VSRERYWRSQIAQSKFGTFYRLESTAPGTSCNCRRTYNVALALGLFGSRVFHRSLRMTDRCQLRLRGAAQLRSRWINQSQFEFSAG
jgi:hypothetical protein